MTLGMFVVVGKKTGNDERGMHSATFFACMRVLIKVAAAVVSFNREERGSWISKTVAIYCSSIL